MNWHIHSHMLKDSSTFLMNFFLHRRYNYFR